MEAVILIGIQAVGKSTFYKQRFLDTHVRLNLDMLKTRHRERLLLEACLAAKQSFVVDNTNVTIRDRARYIAPSKGGKFRVIAYYFRSSVEEALQRNAQRGTATVIPERGIAGTHKRLQPPSYTEGFDELHYVTLNNSEGFTVRGWGNEA